MANGKRNGNSSLGTTTKRKVNPVQKEVKRVIRPKLDFDGTTLNGTGFFTREVSVANVSSNAIMIDCSNANFTAAPVQVTGVANALTGLTKFYQEYRYNSVHIRWVPHVAPGVADAGSIIYVAYIDNPELIAGIAINTAAVNLAFIKGVKNVKTFNAWQGFDYYAPLTRRLPWFNVNPNTTNAVDVAERSTQGAILLCTETIGGAVDTGAVHVTYSVDLKNLTLSNMGI